MHGEARELLEDVRSPALGAGHGLVARADELVEVRLALHARVLVDRHASSVTSAAVERWTAPTLEGGSARLEPLRSSTKKVSGSPRATEDLALAERRPAATRDEWSVFVGQALDAANAGTELPLVTVHAGEVVGSTRFLTLRPEHRSVEIGWTWLHPSVWGTGVNVEAKYLQLRHAFDEWGCRRVEWKTDAENERSCGALAALGATFEGVHRNHMLVRDGENRDSAWYSVTGEEWPAVRAHLESRLAEK